MHFTPNRLALCVALACAAFAPAAFAKNYQIDSASTDTLELKKADQKKSRFSISVFSDDKQYDKKDRYVNEPLQFYAGKDPALYEIVVNSVPSKNTISGYLSTPKGAPAPPNVQ